MRRVGGGSSALPSASAHRGGTLRLPISSSLGPGVRDSRETLFALAALQGSGGTLQLQVDHVQFV